MITIAILSPQKEAYSETFIHAHRDYISGNVLFYHSGMIPSFVGEIGIFSDKFLLQRFLQHLTIKPRAPILSKEEFFFLKSLKKTKPDVILAEYGTTAAIALPVIRMLNIPLVVHFHGYDASCNEVIRQFRTLYQELFDYASSIISVSVPMTRKLVELGCPEQKIIQTTYGPNDIFFMNKPTFARPIFLAVGRFVEKKAPHCTIFAFHEMLKSYPSAELCLAGDGPLKTVCEDLVINLGIKDRVSFTGILSQEAVRKKMESAMAFVQHSKTASDGDMEGTPVGILEAQAAALPVVSTFHAGIPEVVTHGETGFLVKENDVVGMSKYMIKILESLSEAKKMGEAGRTRVLRHFTLEKHIATLQKVLLDAAG